jgi:aminotransferase in exopolysaccharide biosynthesis
MNIQKFIDFVRSEELYNTDEFIPLHAPVFRGNEKKYLTDCIDTTFVSSVGKYVDRFEQMCAEYTGAKYAVAAVNGTAALHVALKLSNVGPEDEVLTQALTFVATANAISYTGAQPVFIDVDRDRMGLSPAALRSFLTTHAEVKDGACINTHTGRTIKACIPMHTFGIPCRIDEIQKICREYNIVLIEDAAESLGSFYKGQHTGTFGAFGTLSFNGNKTITCGGGGMLLTNDEDLARAAKHITTTAKVPHKWEYVHDVAGFNYRLTNLSAALGCAQMEQLDDILANKRETAEIYQQFFQQAAGPAFVKEPAECRVNYWLNALVMESPEERDRFLEATNEAGVMTRPIWRLMNELKMYKGYQSDSLSNSKWLEERIVNIPSSVR